MSDEKPQDSYNEQVRKINEEIYEGKRRRRQQLANLPFEEKVKILIRLQHINKEIMIATGRPFKKPWGPWPEEKD